MKKHFLLVIFSILLFQTSFAQKATNYGLPTGKEFDRWSFGLTLGLSHLLGDLLSGDEGNNRILEQGNFNPSFGFQVNHQISHSIGIRGRGLFTKFSGFDKDYLKADGQPVFYPGKNDTILTAEKFSTSAAEGTIDLTYNFGNISFLNRNKNFHFVFTLGVGFVNYNAQVHTDSINSRLLRETGSQSQIMVPIGLGFKYKVNKVDIGMSMDYRRTYVDNLDATIKTFSENDDYIMLNFGVNYTIGKKKKPMEWINPLELVYNDLADMKEKIEIISGDKDKDGVSDLFDKDNSTPEGSKVYGDGTTVDTDGDGVPDSKDGDPFTMKGAIVDVNGMENDTDKDGVSDSHDLEPDTKPGSLVNFQGVSIPVSTDDGKNGMNGRDGTGFLPSIFFDIASANIKPLYHDRLLVIAKLMKNNPELKLKITGNTDITGSEPINTKLGNRRAESVKQHFVAQYGIDPSRMTTETKGEKDPLASKLNTMNRRVDFSVE